MIIVTNQQKVKTKQGGIKLMTKVQLRTMIINIGLMMINCPIMLGI